MAQRRDPSTTLTPQAFTRARLHTPPTTLLFDDPWNTRDPTHAIEAPITSWKLTPTAPPSPSLRQPTADLSADVHYARFETWSRLHSLRGAPDADTLALRGRAGLWQRLIYPPEPPPTPLPLPRPPTSPHMPPQTRPGNPLALDPHPP